MHELSKSNKSTSASIEEKGKNVSHSDREKKKETSQKFIRIHPIWQTLCWWMDQASEWVTRRVSEQAATHYFFVLLYPLGSYIVYSGCEWWRSFVIDILHLEEYSWKMDFQTKLLRFHKPSEQWTSFLIRLSHRERNRWRRDSTRALHRHTCNHAFA